MIKAVRQNKKTNKAKERLKKALTPEMKLKEH